MKTIDIFESLRVKGMYIEEMPYLEHHIVALHQRD